VAAATLLLTAAMVLALSSLPGHEAAAGQRPNVVVVMTDDQDAGSVSVMNSLDRFVAQRGVTFDNFFATFPLCCPSRASFLTGQYPHNHGVLSNGGPKGGADELDDSRTLPVRLDRAGYRTGFVGKYLNGFSGNDIPPGWDEWNRTAGSKMYDYGLVQDGRRVAYGSRARDYQTDVVARKAKHIIATTPRSRPLFLTVSTLAPHGEPGVDSRRNPRPAERHRRAFERTSLPKPPSFNERDMSDKPRRIRDKPRITRRGARKLTERYQDRLASLLAVDDLVKKLVKKLRRRNELDNTVIMFTSDNGFMLGEHRVKGKKRLYEESVGVPLVMSGPGIPGGLTRRQVTGNIDLAPTILDLANVSGARRMDGTSLLPVINDPSVASDRELLLRNARSTAIRTPDFLYADHRQNESELYDMRDDPFQLESLHDEPRFQDVKNDLEKRLRALENCRAESCRR
jgi:arylsulfatase A-like enzyme